MRTVGRFFKRLWLKAWPTIKVTEPVAIRVLELANPKLAPILSAGQVAIGAIKGVNH